MRTAIRLALVNLLFVPAVASAQSPRDKVQIMAVRIGFPPGPQGQAAEEGGEVLFSSQRQTVHKPGAWTPVYISIINNGKYDPDPKKDGPGEVVVEVADCDDTTHSYTVPLPALDQPGDRADLIAYTRAGSSYNDFTIRVQTLAGRDLCQAQKVGSAGIGSYEVLYLALGSNLPGLSLPGQAEDRNPNVPGNTGNRSDAARLTRVPELPPNWFGYDAADVVILATSDRNFMTTLVGDFTRTSALAEWVRRGGRLIILAGPQGSDLVKGNVDLNALLPMDIGIPYKARVLQPIWKDGGSVAPEPLTAGRDQEMELPKFLPRENPARAYRVLMDGPKGPEGDGSPLVVQGSYGLGLVTLVALDLDKPPFNKWPGRRKFWEDLLLKAGPRLPANVAGMNYGRLGPRGIEAEADAQLQGLNGQLENFEGVPVISFGWVALFILLYILVVGPLDYLFLKKVVKRLELTWITFPTVVLAVSAAAYFTAYYLKGSELRINKIDLVDVDMQTQRVYGRTWMSVFSPRIQKYTVGVQPADGWATANAGSGPDATVTWFGAPKQGRQSLFRHSYAYAPLAEGLSGVPIQVWTTKGFQASWQAPLPKEAPPVENQLRHPPGRPDELIGSITSHLPAPLEETVLIYKGEVAQLGTLLPGQKKVITAQTRVPFSTWASGSGAAPSVVNLQPGTVGSSASTAATAGQLFVSLLFSEKVAHNGDPNNASLRTLDQSWRVDGANRDEVILLGRLAREQGQAETVTAGPASPSRLWLGALPSSGQPRPTLTGKMRQDTVVRIFLPITPEPQP